MKNILLVFLGGGLGSITRYGAGRLMGIAFGFAMPWATLCINVAACFILGWFLEKAASGPSAAVAVRLLIATGFCGGLSTFSTFAYETYLYLRQGNTGQASLLIACSLLFCLLSVWAGAWLAAKV